MYPFAVYDSVGTLCDQVSRSLPAEYFICYRGGLPKKRDFLAASKNLLINLSYQDYFASASALFAALELLTLREVDSLAVFSPTNIDAFLCAGDEFETDKILLLLHNDALVWIPSGNEELLRTYLLQHTSTPRV